MGQRKRDRHSPGAVVLATATLLAIMIWLSDRSGWLNVFDDVIYDRMANRMRPLASLPSSTALCYCRRDQVYDPEDFASLLNQIAEAGAIGIVVTIPGVVPFGGQFDPCRCWIVAPDQVATRPTVIQRQGLEPDQIVVQTSADMNGVVRWHRPLVSGNGGYCRTIETVAAERMGIAAGNRPFRITYRGGPGSLPYWTADDIRERRLPGGMVSGRVVLIGIHDPNFETAHVTPTSDDRFLMTPLEIHGHTLNSILHGYVWVDVDDLLQLAWLLALGLLLPSVHRQARMGPGVWLLFFSGVAMLALTAAMAVGCGIWMRPGASLVLLSLSCFVSWETQIEQLRRRTRAFCLQLISDQRQDVLPSRFVSSDDPWELANRLILELLAPDRFVLLRTLIGQTYVTPAQASGCTCDDILERRRDFRRDPYEAAVQQCGPLPLEAKWTFLKSLPRQQQFLCPLSFRGELMGFLAVSVDEARLQADAQFVSMLSRLSDQIAEMLQRRQKLVAEERNDFEPVEGNTLADWDRLLRRSSTAARRLRGRTERFQTLFHASPVASLVFDLYGNLVASNDAMQQLWGREGWKQDQSCQVLVAQIRQQSTESLRSDLRTLLVHDEPQVRTVWLPVSGTHYFCHMSSVPATPVAVGTDDIFPFQRVGIRVDMIPALGVETSNWIAQELTELACAEDFAEPEESTQRPSGRKPYTPKIE